MRGAPPGRLLWAWAAVAACIALIWTLSSEGFSGTTTSRFLGPFLRWLHPEISGRTLYEIHYYVRKTAHVSEYALLALLAFRALSLSLDRSMARLAMLALGLVLAVASLDELRQSFLPARNGSPADVALDLTGGLFGVTLIVGIYRALGVGAPLPKEET